MFYFLLKMSSKALALLFIDDMINNTCKSISKIDLFIKIRKDGESLFPIHYMIKCNRYKFIDKYISQCMNVVDDMGNTILHYITQYITKDHAEKYIHICKPLFKHQNINGETALMYAVKYNPPLVKYLLNEMYIMDNKGYTALIYIYLCRSYLSNDNITTLLHLLRNESRLQYTVKPCIKLFYSSRGIDLNSKQIELQHDIIPRKVYNIKHTKVYNL